MAKTCLYHPDYPKGKIFEDEEEPALLKQGWVDAEWKVKAGPPKEEGQEEGSPSLKPWEKAVAAKKAKRAAAQGEK